MSPDHGGLRVAVVAAREAASVEQLLRGLPDALRFALVLVSPLSLEAVRSVSRVPAVAVDQRTPVEHGWIYVVPVDRDVRFIDGQLIPGEDRSTVARLDVLLRSVADELGSRTTAVVLAGRGDGGALGIQRVKEVGGWTFAHDADGEHGEMPRAAIATGRIELVLPIDQLAARLPASAAAPERDLPDAGPDADEGDALRDILATVRAGSGHDVGVYRRATLIRRIARRMQVCGSATIAAYRDHLRDRPGELAHLVRDLLIRTTQFFRDPEAFDAIARDVMPGLFSGKRAGDHVRIWVAGCATGEEVYSLGILVLEHAARLQSAPQIQLFATDVDDKALAFARQGCYPPAIALDVAPARLQRFFTRDGVRYRVHDALRELVLFAGHDVLRDPPFSRLDLISCRGLMTELEHGAQRRALARFHYGLRGAGVLLLDRSDAADGSGLFAAVDRDHGVFARLASTSALDGSPGRTGRWRAVAGVAASPARIDGGFHAGPAQPAVASSVDPEVSELVDELHLTRERLRITVEQYEASLEELKASNEELHAINDELRYATSELEISKEELQSINEELMALNQELRCKVDEVGRANSDLQNLMTSTEIGVVFLDRGLCIQRFTPSARDVFNIIPSDLGRPLAHLTHRLVSEPLGQDMVQDMWQIAQSVLDTLRPVERELRHRDGRCFLARWLPYRSVEGRIDGIVLTFVDVTDLRDAVAARRRSEAALHQVEERLGVALRSAPLAALGFEGPTEVDPRALVATWGFLMGRELDAGERAGLPMLVAGHGERLCAGVRQAIAERAGQRAELDLEIDGAPRTFDFRIEPTASGATAVGFDITPSKLAEAALREADRRKDEFLATVSHELRNPLAPLQVALEAARLLDDDPRQRARSLSIMERQITMLTTLVNELLDLSRISQGKIVLERAIVSLAHALESAVIATRPMFEAAHHELRIDVPDRSIEVDGDFRRLVQVFTNLLTNAAKYTPPSGHIDVAIVPGPARVAVRVQDDGLGITSDMLPRIFDIFVQSHDARERSQGGLGIGLNLVRRLVELHGGTVTAVSAGAGRGSAFTVELPLHTGGSPA